MNQQAIMRKMRQLRQEMEDTQKEIEQTEFNMNKGPVTITMMGDKTIAKVKIDASFQIEDDSDREILEDLIVAINSQLIAEIDEFTSEKMSKFSQLAGLGL